jgi:hypothetical protein
MEISGKPAGLCRDQVAPAENVWANSYLPKTKGAGFTGVQLLARISTLTLPSNRARKCSASSKVP